MPRQAGNRLYECFYYITVSSSLLEQRSTIKRYFALDAKDVISTFSLKKKKQKTKNKERNTSRRDSLINCAQDRSHKSIHSIKIFNFN